MQGSPIDQLLPQRSGAGGDIGRIEIVGEDIELLFLQPGDEKSRRFQISRVLAQRDDVRLAIDATVDLPDDLGRRMTVTATQLLSEPVEASSWDIAVEIDNVELAGVTAMQPEEAAHFDSGAGDIELSLAIANKRIQSATADIDIDDIAIAGLRDLAVSGRLEYRADDNGWLVAANGLRARTPTGEWPPSMLRFEASTDDAGNIVMIDARASYLDFSHIPVVEPWLSDDQRALIADLDPSGIVHDLAVTLSDIDTGELSFDISVEFENLGIAANGKRPGVRGFSGNLRADHSSGLLEIDTNNLTVEVPDGLSQPLRFDEASGTLIWRRSNNRTTVLSDSIVLRNAILDNETSVEISFADDGSSPFIDLESEFSVSDIAAASQYVPFMPKRPRMSQWFHEGFVAGRVPRGRARLYGPLDQFPFTGDEGQLLIEGTVRDAIVIYQPKWPAARVIEADVVLENMSLRSERSRVINAGNATRLSTPGWRSPISASL